MNFKLLLGVGHYPALSTARAPPTWTRGGLCHLSPTRCHSHRGHWNPSAYKLTDSKAVIELEAAEYLVDIPCMIKAVASYHNLKGFCK